MLKTLCLAAGLAASIAFGGCSTAQLQNAQTVAQKFQSDVTLACNVLQPAIAPFAPFFIGNAPVTAFNADVVLACGTNAALNLASITNVINTSGAAAQAVIPQIKGLQPTEVALIQGLIGAFQGSLKNALAAYQAGTAAATPTTGASAPVAASA
jgi:hypothetical protein